MNIAAALNQLYPGIDLLAEVELRDEGAGAFIARWNRPEPPPSPELLAATWDTIKDLPAPPPLTITPAQLRVWCIRHGVPLAAIDACIDAIADPTEREEARVRWEYSTEVRRDFPLVAQLAAALGMTDAQVDDAFRESATL